MRFSARSRYLMVSSAVLIASLIQWARGYRPLIVFVALGTFLLAGNAMVYLSGARERSMRRQQKRDYFAGKV
jgi:O-antigen ligase